MPLAVSGSTLYKYKVHPDLPGQLGPRCVLGPWSAEGIPWLSPTALHNAGKHLRLCRSTGMMEGCYSHVGTAALVLGVLSTVSSPAKGQLGHGAQYRVSPQNAHTL